MPPGIAQGEVISSWLNPTSLIAGALGIGTAAYLAAGIVVGALSAVGLVVLRADAPGLSEELATGRALSLVIGSVVAGLASLVLLWRRAYLAVRLTAALAVTALLWGWGVAQYPVLLPGVTLDDAVATQAVLAATLGALAAGALLLVPSLWWLYAPGRERTHESHIGVEAATDNDAYPSEGQGYAAARFACSAGLTTRNSVTASNPTDRRQLKLKFCGMPNHPAQNRHPPAATPSMRQARS